MATKRRGWKWSQQLHLVPRVRPSWKAIERACHDVGKGSDDKEGEEPAEQEEHLAARLANVLFNDLAHALAVVAD